jgi:glc operon protein GlcG
MLQKLDNTQNGSVAIAIGKARAALDFRRPSKAMQDVVAGGGAGLRLLSVRNMLAPVIVDGKVVGAVGVSGVTSEQDAQVAMAGAAAAQ